MPLQGCFDKFNMVNPVVHGGELRNIPTKSFPVYNITLYVADSDAKPRIQDYLPSNTSKYEHISLYFNHCIASVSTKNPFQIGAHGLQNHSTHWTAANPTILKISPFSSVTSH